MRREEGRLPTFFLNGEEEHGREGKGRREGGKGRKVERKEGLTLNLRASKRYSPISPRRLKSW